MLTSGVIITIIICVTLVIMSVINAISKAIERKKVNKDLKPFNDAFPTFTDNSKDYFKKF